VLLKYFWGKDGSAPPRNNSARTPYLRSSYHSVPLLLTAVCLNQGTACLPRARHVVRLS